MAEIYKTVFSHKIKTLQTLIANFKENNLKYDGQIRSKTENIHRCYIGIKAKLISDNLDPFISDDEDKSHDYQNFFLKLLNE